MQQNLSKKVVFLGFQTGRLAVFSRGFGISSSFRAMVFSCRKVILSKLFECKQPQATAQKIRLGNFLPNS